jgi:tyrosyl-tRNA synthetase
MSLGTRGVTEIFPGGEAALDKLLAKTDRPLRVKLGVDPTRPDLHLGHMVALNKLRQFQDLGHTAVLIIGDFTALIGDPTGRSEARPRLTPEEVSFNARTYLDQAEKILHPDRLEIRHNKDWLGTLDLSKIIDLLTTMTMQQMLAKEGFKERYEKQQPVYLHEFLYPIMQGYDSVAIHADIELGGTDQKFNLAVGRDLQTHFQQTPQLCILVPLLVGLDGVKKMSKSFGNYVGISEDPLTMYQKLEKVPDSLLDEYFHMLTTTDIDTLPSNPRERQKHLALTLITLLHGESAAQCAQQDALKLTQGETSQLEQAPVFAIHELTVPFPASLPQVLKAVGLCKSTTEAAKRIKEGGVKLNGEKITDDKYTFATPDALNEVVMQLGKKNTLRFLQKLEASSAEYSHL